jgi:AhpD family alkylhydroperoxidase
MAQLDDTDTGPRVPPATPEELGWLNAKVAELAGRVVKTTKPLNLFTTVGRHRWLFRRWLVFAGALMPRGKLPRADTELVILRVSHRTGAEYEAVHHRRMGRAAGLSEEQTEAVARDDLSGGPWSERQRLLLTAVDELHDESKISDETFAGLRPLLSDNDLIELCMLAGHYSMVAGLITSLRIESDVQGAGG